MDRNRRVDNQMDQIRSDQISSASIQHMQAKSVGPLAMNTLLISKQALREQMQRKYMAHIQAHFIVDLSVAY